jgi:hypothetical protein
MTTQKVGSSMPRSGIPASRNTVPNIENRHNHLVGQPVMLSRKLSRMAAGRRSGETPTNNPGRCSDRVAQVACGPKPAIDAATPTSATTTETTPRLRFDGTWMKFITGHTACAN